MIGLVSQDRYDLDREEHRGGETGSLDENGVSWARAEGPCWTLNG